MQLRWSFAKSAFALWQVLINNCIVFSQSPLIVLMMPRPTIIDIRHEVLAVAREGIWQSAIAGHVGLTHATVNCNSGGMLSLELW